MPLRAAMEGTTYRGPEAFAAFGADSREAWEEMTKAGLRRLRFHDPRHSFGTLAVATYPIPDVQAWVGHANIQTTMRYVHHTPKHEAVERLGVLIGGENVAPGEAPSTRHRRSSERVGHA